MRDFFMNEQHARLLLDSYKHWTGQELIQINESGSLLEQVHNANVIILSHGIEPDPILNYGNKLALTLWEMTPEQFHSTPSRLTAEPMERAERESFLKEVTSNGFVSNYTGIRISRTGKRFFIKQATVWNLIDAEGGYCGQAATFKSYSFLDET